LRLQIKLYSRRGNKPTDPDDPSFTF